VNLLLLLLLLLLLGWIDIVGTSLCVMNVLD